MNPIRVVLGRLFAFSVVVAAYHSDAEQMYGQARKSYDWRNKSLVTRSWLRSECDTR